VFEFLMPAFEVATLFFNGSLICSQNERALAREAESLQPLSAMGSCSGVFGNGQTNVFDPISNALLGTVDGPNGAPLVIANLWALDVRTGGTGVNTSAVYFAAGISGQRDGLFGSIQVVPEPSGWLITGSGLMLAAAFGCRGSGRARRR
jgi:hypothetical protein